MAKFSVEGDGEGPSNSPKKRKADEGEGASSSPKKRRRADADAEDFQEICDDEPKGSEISISIDPDVLDCSICMDPLIPPVFQCENGHIACSSCCTKLKNKCHTCSWPIGYNRCLAIEKVIESVKMSCRNTRYGCKEKVGYTHKTTHEQTCIYAPCACPVSGCTFLGSSEQLSLHFCSKHWASAVRFRYNCPFPASIDKNEPFVILQSEDGHLFLINNIMENIGNAVAVTSIGPSSPIGGFSYDLITRNGERSLRLQSTMKNIQQRTDTTSLSMDFLLVPHGFPNCLEQLKMEVCIWSTR